MNEQARVLRIDTTSRHAASLDGMFFAQADAGERQVSLMMGEAEEVVRAAGGLCTARFHADIVTAGLSFSELTPGTRLGIGGCTLSITSVGKRCFDECPIRAVGTSCALPDACAFARVTDSGRAAPGDPIKIL